MVFEVIFVPRLLTRGQRNFRRWRYVALILLCSYMKNSSGITTNIVIYRHIIYAS